MFEDVRLRAALGRAGAVLGRSRPEGVGSRPPAHPDAGGRHGDLPVADHDRRPAGPSPHPHPRRTVDGAGRDRLRLDRQLHPARRRRHGRGHQPQRERDRPVPVCRAGGTLAHHRRRAADGRVRLVQPRRLVLDRPGCAGGRVNCGGVTALQPYWSRCVPARVVDLRWHRRGADRRVCVLVLGGGISAPVRSAVLAL